MNSIRKYSEYLKVNPEGYWFKRKLYGWGWVPARREGWAVLVIFIGYLFWQSTAIGSNTVSSEQINQNVELFLAKIFLAAVILIVVCFWKGEKPGWQWGFSKDNDAKS